MYDLHKSRRNSELTIISHFQQPFSTQSMLMQFYWLTWKRTSLAFRGCMGLYVQKAKQKCMKNFHSEKRTLHYQIMTFLLFIWYLFSTFKTFFLNPQGTINAIVFNLVTTIELLTSVTHPPVQYFQRLLTMQIFSATGHYCHWPASSCLRVHHRVPESVQ